MNLMGVLYVCHVSFSEAFSDSLMDMANLLGRRFGDISGEGEIMYISRMGAEFNVNSIDS
jgi:hypothetical protein